MKRQNFEKAVAINEQLNMLKQLDKLFVDAYGAGHYLASISKNCCSEDLITNDCSLTDDLLKKFRLVILNEMQRLDKEFDEL